MCKFEWSERHAVHVPEVDDEHQLLFRLCRDLQVAIAAGATTAQVQPILDELIAHAAEHFSHEERQMRAAGYSHYAWHQRQHHAARAKLVWFARRIRRGNASAVRELLDFLQGWLNDHIGIADRMLGAYLRNYQRQRTARAS
ncbi:MAG TPA: bacteriohemerythrin [Bryobacteraceae bacterium]|nr:bacteriohemerythrin [Bryobacteraceae bacterium]